MLIDKQAQDHAEKVNEEELAAAIGGVRTKGSHPVDVVVSMDGAIRHGLELKTLLSNTNDKITVKSDALERKNAWAIDNRATLHTVVFDDRDLESGRKIYWCLGCGAFRLSRLSRLHGGLEELANLLQLIGPSR